MTHKSNFLCFAAARTLMLTTAMTSQATAFIVTAAMPGETKTFALGHRMQ